MTAVRQARLPVGQLVPGPTTWFWQHALIAVLGAFLAVLASVPVTAPAFHPEETAAAGRTWGVVFLLTFFPVLLAGCAAVWAMINTARREVAQGYTTDRSTAANIEVRDRRGQVIPPGDRRLSRARRRVTAFIAFGSVCSATAPLLWLVRLLV